MTFNFTEISTKTVSGNICIKSYFLDSSFQSNLELYLKGKIKKIKPLVNIANMSNPLIKNTYIEKLTKAMAYKNVRHFDKRREYVTEFMAQTLLEKQNGVIFFDEVDKRINVEFLEAPKSTDGIDVPGIILGDNSKFVICEVKASDEDHEQVASSTDLLDEIAYASLNHQDRLLNELMDYLLRVPNIEGYSKEMVAFLMGLIEKISSKDTVDDMVGKSIVFIPFLIRKNRIDTTDFHNITDYDTLKNREVIGVIWGIDGNITDFCINIFDQSLSEL